MGETKMDIYEDNKFVIEVKQICEKEVTAEAQMVIEKSKRPEKLAILESIEDYTARKFYHELTSTYFTYLSENEGFCGLDKIEFFRHVVDKVHSKLNPLRLSHLLKIACEHIDAEGAIYFMSVYESTVKGESESLLVFQTCKAYHMTRCRKFKECEDLLEEVGAVLDTEHDWDLSIRALYHKAFAYLYQAMEKLSGFYDHSILYLSYTPLESIPASERLTLAYNITIAVIIADTTFNFGELLQLPLIECLKCKENMWLYELLVAFNEGKWEMYDKALANHNASISQSALGKNLDVMRHKITLLAMMELAFRKPQKNRKLTFNEIAQHCRIELTEVELILMKAMSGGLVKGYIDEIDQVVCLSWVKPRILDNSRLELMAQRINGWSKSAAELLSHLEELTPELLVS